MLSTMLRVELVVLAVLALAVVIYAVNRRALQLKYSLLWMAIALALVVTACFPGTVVALTAWAGIETPSNLIFLLAIVGLLGLCFSLSIIVSRQEAKLKRIIQLLSLDQREWKGRDKPHDPEKEED